MVRKNKKLQKLMDAKKADEAERATPVDPKAKGKPPAKKEEPPAKDKGKKGAKDGPSPDDEAEEAER